LYLVRLRFVPASRFALGREGIHEGMADAGVDQSLMTGGAATQVGFASLLVTPCVGTQCQTDE
jgi:hypothetical protein